MNRNLLLTSILTMFFGMSGPVLHAQEAGSATEMGLESLLVPEDGVGVLPDPGDGGGVSLLTDDPGDGDGAVPVDGGLSILLAAGAAYGVRGLRRRKEARCADRTSR